MLPRGLQQARAGQETHDVAIVPAGVHHRDGLAVRAGGGFGACVGQAGFLFHGEGVHVCAEENGGAGPVA